MCDLRDRISQRQVKYQTRARASARNSSSYRLMSMLLVLEYSTRAPSALYLALTT